MPSCEPQVTINSEDGSLLCSARLILGIACVVSIVVPANTRDDQHAASGADGRGQDARVSSGLAMECPGNGQGLITLHSNAGQLGKVALVNNISAECQGDKLRRNCKGERAQLAISPVQ